MTKSSDWKVLSDETSSDPVSDNNEQNDTQSSERKRRLLSGSKPKTHRKYIQDIVTFLKNEALALEEDVKYEHKQNGSDHTVKVSIGGDFVEAKKKTLKALKCSLILKSLRCLLTLRARAVLIYDSDRGPCQSLNCFILSICLPRSSCD